MSIPRQYPAKKPAEGDRYHQRQFQRKNITSVEVRHQPNETTEPERLRKCHRPRGLICAGPNPQVAVLWVWDTDSWCGLKKRQRQRWPAASCIGRTMRAKP